MNSEPEEITLEQMASAIETVTGEKLDTQNPEHVAKIEKITLALVEQDLSKTPDPASQEGQLLNELANIFFHTREDEQQSPWPFPGQVQYLEGIVIDPDDPLLDDLNATWPLPIKN